MKQHAWIYRAPCAAAIVSCAAGALALSGCEGPQSAIDPAGYESDRIAGLFWGMTVGAVLIWLAFVGLTLYAAYPAPTRYSVKRAGLFILVGGVVFPTVVLAGLLIYGLAMLPPLLAPAPEGSLRILVTGHQWWWRVRYLPNDGAPVDLANEIRLPVGAPVGFLLETPDVIHSFWIPALGGKIDMIPGRTNRLRLTPTRTGVFRGICAEYCGASHALMAFSVVVHEEADFDRWLEHQAKPASPPDGPLAARGRELFLANGCGACHTIRGTPADGVIGPDLTHVGGRLTIGAGVLATEADAIRDWIARTGDIKPSVHMPAFGMLPEDDLRALAFYLGSLK